MPQCRRPTDGLGAAPAFERHARCSALEQTDLTSPVRLNPPVVLLLLAPAVAELLGGATQITQIWLALFYIPVYGAGALLVRELVWRRGLGWWSILLLGAA